MFIDTYLLTLSAAGLAEDLRHCGLVFTSRVRNWRWKFDHDLRISDKINYNWRIKNSSAPQPPSLDLLLGENCMICVIFRRSQIKVGVVVIYGGVTLPVS